MFKEKRYKDFSLSLKGLFSSSTYNFVYQRQKIAIKILCVQNNPNICLIFHFQPKLFVMKLPLPKEICTGKSPVFIKQIIRGAGVSKY